MPRRRSPVAYIPLTGKNRKSEWAVVDASDLPLVSGFTWFPGRTGVHTSVRDHVRKRQRTVLLHRVITNAPRGLVVDHKDHNVLNNRRGNLRVCRQGKNCQNNLGMDAKNILRLRGVYRVSVNYWVATIRHVGVTHYLGHFRTKTEAWNARRSAETRLRGAFAPPLPGRLDERLAAVPPLPSGYEIRAEKKKAYLRAYHRKNRALLAPEMRARSREHYEKNREKILSRQRQLRAEKREAKRKGQTP